MSKNQSIADQLANLVNTAKAIEVLSQLKDKPTANPVKRILVQYEDESTETYYVGPTIVPTNLTFKDGLPIATIKEPVATKIESPKSFFNMEETLLPTVHKDFPDKLGRDASVVNSTITTKRIEGEPIAAWGKRVSRWARPGKACVIEGVKYISVSHAGRELGIHPQTISRYINSDLFPTWNYA